MVDLCCGSGLTSSCLSTAGAVTAVDRRPSRCLPHFQEAQLHHVQYLQLDVLHVGFLEALEERIKQVEMPTVILGMHCCGAARSEDGAS